MKYFSIAAVFFLPALLLAQTPAPNAEAEDLQRVLGEAGDSPVDFIRAIEEHLRQFPNAPRKLELERALVKTAIDLKDTKRIVVFGERVLAAQPDDPAVLQQVSIALLRELAPGDAEKALRYAAHFEELERAAARTIEPNSGRQAIRLKEDTDKGIASALLLQARAQGVLKHTDKAIQLAEQSYAIYPSVESARETSEWYAAEGDNQRAVERLAEAFSIDQLRSTDAQKAQDRARMSELYRKLKGNETGLGDVVLQAYDRSVAALNTRRQSLKTLDPNAQVTDPMQFTLTSVNGGTLDLKSLLGKVVVMDFWATWCGPCRIQHPLYEEVKDKFKNRQDVVFLAIDTDEDRTLVKPFLTAQGWKQSAYFDDGLQSALRVGSIPTTIVFDPKGTVSSRMNGFLPDRFIDMLTERIQVALGAPSGKLPEVTSQ